MKDHAAWLALAYRSMLPVTEQRRIAAREGPGTFPDAVMDREAGDLLELQRLGVRLITIRDPEFPDRLREEGPILLQVAGRPELLGEEQVEVFCRYRGEEGARLAEALDSGSRVVLVLSKGMLKAKSLLRALQEPIADGALTLVSAEPPRASWGPARDLRRDALAERLRG